MKEAAVQRKHNLFRDSIVMSGSDPNLLLLGEAQNINWNNEMANEESSDPASGSEKRRRMKQVVSMIQDDGISRPYEVDMATNIKQIAEVEEVGSSGSSEPCSPVKSPDSVKEIRDLLTIGKIETTVPNTAEDTSMTNGMVCKDEIVPESNPSEETKNELPQNCQESVQSSHECDLSPSAAEHIENRPSSSVIAFNEVSDESNQEKANVYQQKDSSDKETGEEVSIP